MFYIPTRVFTGKDALINNKEYLTRLGHKALIVTGKGSAKKNGSYNDVIDILKESKIEYSVYEGINENPTVYDPRKVIMSGADEMKKFIDNKINILKGE